MPAIQSELDVNGEDFARNREAMLAAVAGFRELEQKVLDKPPRPGRSSRNAASCCRANAWSPRWRR